MNNHIITTGTSSGFGRYVCETLDTNPYNRRFNFQTKANTIIHCAHGGNIDNIYKYLINLDELFLNLQKIKNKKFIFISSIDVYPKDKSLHDEYEKINNIDILGIYGLSKRLIEQHIEQNCRNYLILRCGALLGKYTPNNNLRLLADMQPLSISSKSSFNLITYQQVLEFIIRGIENNWTGIYNIVANDNIRLKDLSVAWSSIGRFKYKTPNISYQKLLKTAPDLVKSSKENWVSWIKNDC